MYFDPLISVKLASISYVSLSISCDRLVLDGGLNLRMAEAASPFCDSSVVLFEDVLNDSEF